MARHRTAGHARVAEPQFGPQETATRPTATVSDALTAAGRQAEPQFSPQESATMQNTGNLVRITDLDSPRLQFNGGYHDARFDISRGTPRQLVPFGKPSEHDVQHVSQGFSPYYFHGYRIGLQSAEDSDSSSGAWLRWLDGLTAADRQGIETHQLLCEIGGLADCLHRAPDAAMIRDARRATAQALAS